MTASNVERKAKFEEFNRRIEACFQKLRKVYDAVNEMSANAEPRPTEACIFNFYKQMEASFLIWNLFAIQCMIEKDKI